MSKKKKKNLDEINEEIGNLVDKLKGVFGDSTELKEVERARKELENDREEFYKTIEEEYINMFNEEFEQNEEGVYIGELYPKDVPEVTLVFMESVALTVDNNLDEVEPYGAVYCEYMSKRGVTYAEFETLFLPIDEADYLKYVAYEFFMLSTKEEKEFLLRNITNDYEGYLSILEKGINRIHSFFFTSKLGVKIPMTELKKHTYVVGKSGSGKSYFLKKLFHQLQSDSHDNKKYSLVLIEPHGDLAMECRDFALNVLDYDRVEYIEADWEKGYVPVINPFDLKDKSKESIGIFTQELTSVFVELLKKNESTAGASLSTQMEALLKPCISVILKMEDGSLEDLQDIMSLSPSPRGEGIIKKGLQSEFKPHAKMFYNAFIDPEMKKGYYTTRKSIFGKLQTLLNEEIFYDMTHGKSTIDLENCLNTGKIVIVNLSKGKIGKDVSQAFGRFVVALIKGIGLKRERIEKKKRKPVFLFVDEFQNYTSESMKEILAELRKYAVHLVISHQNVGQISTSMQTQLLGNTGVKVAGENGNKTLKVMANEMGVSVETLQQLPKYNFQVKVGSQSSYSFKPSSDLVSKTSPHYMTAEEKKAFKNYKIKSGLYRNKNNEVDQGKKNQVNEQNKNDPGGKRKPKYL